MNAVHSVYLNINQRQNLSGDESVPIGESINDDSSCFTNVWSIVQTNLKEDELSVLQVLGVFFSFIK